MALAKQVDFLVAGVVDDSGNVLAAGTVGFYESNGLTLKTIWEDADKNSTMTNPVELDDRGTAIVFADGQYSLIIKDSNGTEVRTPDDFTYEILNDVNVVDALDFGPPTGATIELAINSVTGEDRTINLSPDNWVISSNLVIPSNINLKFQMGAYMTGVGVPNVTYTGVLEAPLYNIHRSTLGTVSFGSQTVFRPTIWEKSGNTDDYRIIGVLNQDGNLIMNNANSLGIGTNSPSASLHIIKITEQVRVGYDISNYFTTTVNATGVVTFNAIGAGQSFVFSDAVSMTSLATSAASPLLLTNGQLVTITLTSQTVGATTLTIPDFAGVVDEFTFKTKSQTMSNKTFIAPALGTPASGILTNCTGTAAGLTAGTVTTNANLTGVITSSGNATSIASKTGTGTKFVVDTSPTLITPILGVASATSLAVNATLNAWGGTQTPIQIGTSGGCIVGSNGGTFIVISSNSYFNGSNYKYVQSEPVTFVDFGGGAQGNLIVYTAPTGVSGNNISLVERFVISNLGAVRFSAYGIGVIASDASGNLTNVTTLPSAVTGSSLTSVGTLTALTVSGNIIGNSDIYTVALTNYFSTSTITGWTSFSLNCFINYKRVGNTVYIYFVLSGTSNSVNTSFTLPYALSPAFGINFYVPCSVVNNGADQTGLFFLNSSIVSFSSNSTRTTGNWTNSGTKTINGSFTYETV